jgi:hypothetical protein
VCQTTKRFPRALIQSDSIPFDLILAVSESVAEQGEEDPGEGLTKHEVMVPGTHPFTFSIAYVVRTVFDEIGEL